MGIAGQNVYWEKEGAYTGEISPGMLVEAGCKYVIVGTPSGGNFLARLTRWWPRRPKLL